MNGPSGDKPYKKFRAGRSKRSRADGKLLGEPPVAAVDGKLLGEPPAATAGDGVRGYRVGEEEAGADQAAAGAAAPRARRRRWFRWWFLLLVPIPFLIVAGVWGYTSYQAIDKAVKKSNRRVDHATRAALTPDDGSLLRTPTTILVLGTDARDQGPSRTDSIMLVRINPKTHTTSQMSIPRDMRVEIAGHGYDKINTAYFWGGGALAIKTVEEFTGIPVNHIVLVDFKGFRKLIDSVGGVWVDIPKTITSWYSGDREVSFRKGHRLLSGRRALIYARIRKVDDDFHRMARQQQVVQGLRAQIVKPGNLWHVSTIAEDFMRGIATELTTNQLIALAYLQWRTDPKHQYKLLMSGTPQYIGGGAYVAPDSAANKRTIRQFLSH